MKPYSTKSTSFLTACLLTAFAWTTHATIVQTVVNGAGYTVLDGMIAANLIRNGQSSLASVTTTHESWGWPTFTTAGA